MSLFAELKRRNVFRVGIAYIVVSWILLQIGDVLFDFLEVPLWAGKLLLAFLALGFVPVLIFSWAYELTPEGIKRESDVDRSRSVTGVTGRKLDLMTMTLVVVGIGFLLVDRFYLSTGFDPAQVGTLGTPGSDPISEGNSALTPSKATSAGPKSTGDRSAFPPEKSIAVLPFVNMSSDEENEYFSDGISEELLNLLARVPHFQVTGRTSSFSFKGQNQDLRAIGEKLRVRNILEGSVRKSGTRVRITAQLVQTDSGYHLWSETFDRELDDIFAIQDEIARAVVAALKETLLGEVRETAPTASTEAYELVLKGRHQWHQRTPESLDKAIAYFEQAVELDPKYVPAHSGLADAHLLSVEYSNPDRADALARAESAIRRAFELDSDSTDASASLGLLEFLRFNAPAAREALERAVERNPNNAMAWMWLANALNVMGEPRAGLEAYERARAVEPLHPTLLSNIAGQWSDFGRQGEALEAARELIELFPERGAGQQLAGGAGFRTGRVDEAVRWSLAAWRAAPERINNVRLLPLYYLSLDADEIAQEWLDFATTLAPGEFLTVNGPSMIMQHRGDHAGRVAYWRERAARYDSWIDHAQLGSAYLYLGEHEAARASFEGALSDGETVRIGARNAGWAVEYALALRATDAEEEAERILTEGLVAHQELLDQGLEFRGGPVRYGLARLLAQQGRPSEALASLRRLDMLLPWLLKDDPALAPLHDDLGYVDLLAGWNDRLAEQRAALEAEGLIAGPAELNERGWMSDR